jgi:hypothetical protein
MLTALLNKLRNFFSTLKSYLNGQGYESYKDIFGKIEKGELKPSKPAEANKEVKKSLTSFGAFYGDEKQPVYTPLSTRNFMEQDMTASQQDLGLNTKAKRGIFNNVRDIASALNQYTIDRFGRMDRNNLSEEQSTQLARAMADEVAFQLGTQAKTGTGLGWYSNNYPKAVKRLASRFPELSDNKHARSVFSALVAVTSNGEKVNKNIDNAITLYAKLRDGKPLIAMGNTCVLIPSQAFPLSATDFYQVLETSDLPAGVVNIVTGSHQELAKPLAGHLDVDAVWSFSSSPISAILQVESAGNVKRTWVNNARALTAEAKAAGHRDQWCSPEIRERHRPMSTLCSALTQ